MNEKGIVLIISIENLLVFYFTICFSKRGRQMFHNLEKNLKQQNDFRAKGNDVSGSFKELIFNKYERNEKRKILPPRIYNNRCAIKVVKISSPVSGRLNLPIQKV